MPETYAAEIEKLAAPKRFPVRLGIIGGGYAQSCKNNMEGQQHGQLLAGNVKVTHSIILFAVIFR
jgi:hypothetical protein